MAREVHVEWDRAWPDIEESIQNRGLEIHCREGCHGCCFDLKSCSRSEGLLIDEFLHNQIPVEQQEHFRSRVESATSCLQKLREQGVHSSADEFERAGGVECAFLERGRCAIYPVRPLACRSMAYATEKDATNRVDTLVCRTCPASVNCLEARVKRAELQLRIDEFECHSSPTSTLTSIAKMLSGLWEKEAAKQPANQLMTLESWRTRLASRGTAFDQTWRDDGFDWEVVKFPVVLPEEGEYDPDLIVLNTRPDTHEIYGEHVRTKALSELRVLYKLLPEGRFNWDCRQFMTDGSGESHIVWMGDSIQERLMMWEAAKRCRGDVLCGGLGMGIFPQFTLSLPQVRSVHIVEMDAAVISLIESTWEKRRWLRLADCRVSASAIEDYLQTTDEMFDTIYIDTWDALSYDYLPHVNNLKELARRKLRPGGEILLWGYDLMVRSALNQAHHILQRRDYFLSADSEQLAILKGGQPLFHKMLEWFLRNPHCSRDVFLSETYRLATTWRKDLGRLSLERFGKN